MIDASLVYGEDLDIETQSTLHRWTLFDFLTRESCEIKYMEGTAMPFLTKTLADKFHTACQLINSHWHSMKLTP